MSKYTRDKKHAQISRRGHAISIGRIGDVHADVRPIDVQSHDERAGNADIVPLDPAYRGREIALFLNVVLLVHLDQPLVGSRFDILRDIAHPFSAEIAIHV